MSKIQLNKYSTPHLLPFRRVTMYILSREVSCLLPVCTIYRQDYKVHIKWKELHSVVTLNRNSLEVCLHVQLGNKALLEIKH